jgi:hypothetical protein
MIDSSSLLISVMALVAMFGGGMIGIFAARLLPGHHLSDSSASAVKLLAAAVGKSRHHGSPAIPPPADLLALPHLRQLRHFRAGNLTVIASFFLCSLAVAGAILMILDLGDPMHPGWVQVSSEPMRRAMIEIGRP